MRAFCWVPTRSGATSPRRSCTARVTLAIGLVATLLSVLIGVTLGAVAGYYGGAIDDLLMRVTEAFQILPNFLLLLVLVAVFGSDLHTVVLAIGLVSWPPVARLTRSEFLTLKAREFVKPAGRWAWVTCA